MSAIHQGGPREAVEAACALVTGERLRELVTGLVAIPSPTGDEAPLAAHIAEVLDAGGIEAGVQPLDARQANAYGRLRPTRPGTAEDLLLYAPIDTLTTGTTTDLPWAGPRLRPDMLPAPVVRGDYVTGLGAGNPKGHAACVIVAVEAVAAAGIGLRGEVLAGFGAGGMPTNALGADGDRRRHTGQGVGCSFLLEQGFWADAAVIAKPGWTVSHEEVGLAWFDVTVHGTHTYVGSRHRLPYRNPIVAAGQVVERLEDWFAEYATRHTTGTLAPQGIVGAVEGGWMRMAAVTPAACRFRADLRLLPGMTPATARREFGAALARIAAQTGAEVSWDLVLAIPGTATDPDCRVARAARAAWEAVEGRPHEPLGGNSGATDANILRARGIPTVRVGMPKVADPDLPIDPSTDFQMGMNTVDVREMQRLTRLLIRVLLDVCGADP